MGQFASIGSARVPFNSVKVVYRYFCAHLPAECPSTTISVRFRHIAAHERMLVSYVFEPDENVLFIQHRLSQSCLSAALGARREYFASEMCSPVNCKVPCRTRYFDFQSIQLFGSNDLTSKP